MAWLYTVSKGEGRPETQTLSRC